jgi:hypothetical protein
LIEIYKRLWENIWRKAYKKEGVKTPPLLFSFLY